ncbi:hypothetical protein JCM19241_2701 [Vibrio ishigakensis]|uniref:Uncharacterized protein n=1 Tax=Vibrio ishigakensis TaxID=1481914 RepID=A0A0B8Q3Y9_9VIBR|nr:hypothetical protein JCM19241_2701 [Vibrio ishigakensis]
MQPELCFGLDREKAEKYFGTWLIDLKHRKPFNVALVALDNNLARITCSVLSTKKLFEIRA